MKETKYQVYLGVINYTITLNEQNKVESLRVGNEIPYQRDWPGSNNLAKHLQTLKCFFKFLLIVEPEKFQQLYSLLKENDPQMFYYAEEVVHELKIFCMELTD